MRTVILVPRRAGFPERDRLWAYCKRWWAENLPDLPIVEGHHDAGLFNRSAAINTAARKAGEWDVALIIDADVILDDPRQAYVAAHTAQESGRLVVAFTERHSLSRRATDRILAEHDKDDWSREVDRVYLDQHSSVIAVPRRLWDEVGGFDENFSGWGQEDTGYAIAAETLGGKRITLPGAVWHLWHPTAPEKHGSPSRTANWNRANRYKDADGDVEAIRAILGETPEAATEHTIPMILHRVVPEVVHPVSERWWQEFQAMNPGWRFMSWQDPLDPAQFPITSPFWNKCAHGAQKADLIRLEALLIWGGLYVDDDVRPIHPLAPLTRCEAFAAYEDSKVVCNAVLGARRNHPAIQECLDLALDRLNPNNIWAGGPGVVTEIFRGREDVLLLPPETFYPVSYRDPDRDQLMRDFDPDEHPATFGMHAYAFSWAADPRDRHPLENIA